MRGWSGWRLWPWLPLLFAAAYLVALAADFRDLVPAIYYDSDHVSALTIGELYDERAPGAEVVLGNFPWYSTLFVERLTAGFPAHRELWQLGPWLLSLVGVGLVAWAAWRAAGAWAAAIVGVALACAGPPLLGYQFAGSIHAPTFFHVCLLGAFMVAAAERGGMLGGRVLHVLAGAALAAVTAVGLASDQLLLPAGIAPFLLAALALVWLLPAPAGKRLLVSAVAISVTAVILASLLQALAEHEHVRAYHYVVSFAPFDRLVPNLRLLFHSLAFLFNGDFGGMRLEAKSFLALACAVALAAALVVVFRYLRAWLPSALAERPVDGRGRARAAYVAFWTLAGVVLALAFVFTTTPIDKFSARYVLTVGYAVIALLPLAAAAAGQWMRIGVVTGVCLVVVGAVAGLVRHDIQDNASRFPTPAVSGPLVRLAQEQHLERGYAGYWTAAPLTWQAKGAVDVYPVQKCPAAPRRLCAFPFHRIDSWYIPQPGKRSFLVVDAFQPSAAAPDRPNPAFGRPALVKHIGQLTVYIYDHDIADRFG